MSTTPDAPPAIAWHARSAEQSLTDLGTSKQGLTAADSANRLKRDGPNRLGVAKRDGALVLLWRQINNPISWVLMTAGGLALILGRPTDALVVFGAVVVNAVIGFLQEYQAGKDIAALAVMVPVQAQVRREGQPVTVPAQDLVVGEVVLLQGGDQVPADLRLVEVTNLLVEEAALTGESLPVAKQVDPVAANAGLGDRTCLAFGGTLVTRGTAVGVVVATGDATELGRIQGLLDRTEALQTPLTRQLAVLSGWITGAVVVLSTIIAGYGWLVKGARLGESLMTGITLAVAAIPEGLPAIITIALAIGVRRMAARQAIVRHLPAVETLGSTSVICSDKTGTLTRNEMTVEGLWASGRAYALSGTGYQPVGALSTDGQPVTDIPADLRDLLEAAVLCNDAGLAEVEGRWVISGDPTEAAMVVAGRKIGLDEGRLRADRPRRAVLPFESETRYMATLHPAGDGAVILLKGAPEEVFARCDLSPEDRAAAIAEGVRLGENGMRVLAVASRSAPGESNALTPKDVAGGLRLLGVIGMIDPPRQEAIAAIAVCRAAGVTVKMITGDHRVTAAAIGRQLGLLGPDDQAIEGSDLDGLDDHALGELVRTHHVFARVVPEHKIRLVTVLQAAGQVVAMTGDGVNDAPALKKADVGVAMGITGTAVSKEAAKIVLADDNFATIAAAIEEGRRVYDNLIKALAFILPTNLGLALLLAGGMFFLPTVEVPGLGRELLLPLSPTQILWVNLVASITLSIPFAFEVLEPGAMTRQPRRRGAPVFTRFVAGRTVLVALLMAVSTCLLFLWSYRAQVGALDVAIPADLHRTALAHAQTLAVTAVVFFQAFYLLHCRSLTGGLGAVGWRSNPVVWYGIGALLVLQGALVHLPFLHPLFGTVALGLPAWGLAAGVASVVLPVISLEKRLWREGPASTTPPAV